MRWWFISIVLVLGVVWGRAWWSARADLERAQYAEKTGQFDQAIERYQYAARWYTPWASAPAEGREGLERIAKSAQARGAHDVALKAYRRLRGAILATRGLFQPGIERLQPTNQKIAALTADAQLASGSVTVAGRTRAQLVKDHLALLNMDPTPSRGWSLIIIFSFFSWIVACLLVIRRGLTPQLRVERGPLLRWGLVALASFGVWILALTRA